METIFTAIKNIPEQEAPRAIKLKTHRRILVIKLRPYIYALTLALSANLILVANHLLKYIINSSAVEVIKVIISDFDLSFDYIANSLLGLKEVLPLFEVSLVLVNIVLVIGLIKIFQRYYHELLKI